MRLLIFEIIFLNSSLPSVCSDQGVFQKIFTSVIFSYLDNCCFLLYVNHHRHPLTFSSVPGERVSFAVTLLLAMTVFMLIVADLVPASSETIPLLGVFFTAVMVEMVLMVFTMCYVLKLHLKDPDEEITPFMRRFVYDFLAFKFNIRKGKRPHKSSYCMDFKMAIKPSGHHNNHKSGSIKSGSGRGLEESNDADYLLNNGRSGRTSNGNAEYKRQLLLQDEERARVSEAKEAVDTSANTTAALMEKNLKVVTDKMKEEENEKRIKHEYEVCASTLDILSLIVFVILFILITLVYFVSTT